MSTDREEGEVRKMEEAAKEMGHKAQSGSKRMEVGVWEASRIEL